MISTRIVGMETLLARVQTVADGVDDATLNGILAAADEAVFAMEDRIEEAVTRTGMYRASLGAGKPGRIETGRMISSLRQDDGTPGHVYFSPSGNMAVDVGFINNPPDYTIKQEFDEYSGDTLLATQRAYNVLASDTRAYVKEEVDELVKQSVRGSYTPRQLTFGPRRFS